MDEKKKDAVELQPLTNKQLESSDELAPIDEKELQGSVTWALFFALCVCGLGSSFQFGYNIGVVNNPEPVVRKWINETYNRTEGIPMTKEQNTFIWSITVSIFAIGGMIGGLFSGWTADKMGRKGGMLFNNLFAFLAAGLMGLSKYNNSYYLLIFGRFVIGVNSGLNSGFAPMYLTEISPVNLRGAVGSVHQLIVTISILVAQILGIFLGTETLWPYVFALTAAPGVFQLLLLPFCPESPQYNLIHKNLTDQATKDLMKLRGKDNVATEIEVMRREAKRISEVKQVSWADMFKYPLLWPLSIAMVMMLSQQLSGINVAMFYSSNIFNSVGLVGAEAQIATLLMGALNVAMTVVSVLMVERFGRRVLHLTGMAGMCLTTILLCIFITIQMGGAGWAGYMCVVWVLAFVVSFATGPGSIPWFFVSELFRQDARGNANSIAIMVNWLANFLVGLFFLPIKEICGQYSFLFFTAFLAIFIVYTYFFVPETKGKSIDVIVKRFEDRIIFAHKD